MDAIEAALAQFEQTVQALQRLDLTAAIEAARQELGDLRLAPGAATDHDGDESDIDALLTPDEPGREDPTVGVWLFLECRIKGENPDSFKGRKVAEKKKLDTVLVLVVPC